MPPITVPPFQIIPPPTGAAATPLVFASPHSGDAYPDDMGARGDLSAASLRSAEDALVDRLIATGPAHGAPLLHAVLGRAYVDLNRAEDELDPLLIDGAPDATGPKVQAGYGVLPRLTGDGMPLYDRRLTVAEAEGRLAAVHRPYHAALADLMAAAHARHGRAVLIDWHSMPARAAGGRGGPDVVLGDRHGASCGGDLSRLLRRLFEAEGLRVAMNRPYAGGHATRLWGRPHEGHEAIQVELNRALYLDEATLTPLPAFARRKGQLDRVIAALCTAYPG